MIPAELIAAARAEAEACPWSRSLGEDPCPLVPGVPRGDKSHVNVHLAAAVSTWGARVVREATTTQCPKCGANCYARALNAAGPKIYDENTFCPTCGAHQLATGPPCSNGCDEPKRREKIALGKRKAPKE